MYLYIYVRNYLCVPSIIWYGGPALSQCERVGGIIKESTDKCRYYIGTYIYNILYVLSPQGCMYWCMLYLHYRYIDIHLAQVLLLSVDASCRTNVLLIIILEDEPMR